MKSFDLGRRVYSVTQINRYVKNLLMQDGILSGIWMRGEISNYKMHSSGHRYFTLKDETGSLNAVLFASNRRGLDFSMKNGDNVIVLGSISVYERDGRYQLYVKEITLDGTGALYEEYERLKAKLYEEGLFDFEVKKPIPKFPKRIGIVTAPTGAAIQDIRIIARRRNPYVQLYLYPAKVQGEGAAATIVKGIQVLDRMNLDTIIIGRGGGSIEDLWAFNEREVAQAVFDCSVPVISAVGHETDTTIVDFVADLRAPTPSAAAELAVTDIRDTLGAVSAYREGLRRLMQKRLQESRAQARQMELKLRLDSPASRIRERKMMALSAEERLQERMRRLLERHKLKLAVYIERMRGLSPLEKLNSGYSYVEDGAGHNVRSVRQVREGQEIMVRVKDGGIRAKVLRILPPEDRDKQTC